jgi:hypothetical protein
MVILSRVLGRGANRWVNIGSGAFHTVFVAWSLIGSPLSADRAGTRCREPQ